MTDAKTTPNDSNKVSMGLSNVTIWPKTGETEWGTAIKIPGAISLSPSPEGSTDTLYADNGKFYVSVSNTGWTFDLEMVKFPDEFYTAVLGWRIDDNGSLIEVSDAQPTPFALGFEVFGDKAKRRNVFYECTATRPTCDHKTTEDKATPSTEKSSITACPVDFGDVKTSKLSLPYKEASKTVWDKFFETVVKPTFEAA